MDNKLLQKKLARAESKLDQAEAELGYLNALLLQCGFPEGINTLKGTIEQLLVEAGDTDLPTDEDPPIAGMGFEPA